MNIECRTFLTGSLACSLMPLPAWCDTNERVATPPGKSSPFRLVLESAKRRAEDDYYLLIREGDAGRIRFNRVVIERLDK